MVTLFTISFSHILHEISDMKKLLERCVPCLLRYVGNSFPGNMVPGKPNLNDDAQMETETDIGIFEKVKQALR